jgi:hypothetical protein
MTATHQSASDDARAYHTARLAAIGSLVGIALSGPLAVVLVNGTRPQPQWRDPELFARSYHAVQLLPYAGGIFLVASLILLVSSIHASAGASERPRTAAALIFTGAFAAFIFCNYVVQTTYLPDLARRYEPATAPIITTLSMSNPSSLTWGIEMWGWGLFGAATWLVSPVFNRSGLERATALVFLANGPVSIAGALWTVVRPGWVMTPAGLAAFAAWNILLAVMAALAVIAFGRRLRPVAASQPGGAWCRARRPSSTI